MKSKSFSRSAKKRRLPQLDPLPESVSPLTDSVRQYLEDLIAGSRPGVNQRLPSARQLAEELGVSRNTVVAAYQELVTEGFVEARPRSGFYVNPEVATMLEERRTASHHQLQKVGFLPTVGPPFSSDPFPHIHKPEHWATLPYPFICGQVELETFPCRAWIRYLALSLDGANRAYSLADRPETDDPLLVQMLCKRLLPSRGIQASPEMVLITLGTQGGLSLVADLLAHPGALAAVEDPGYPDTRHILHRAGWQIATLPVDESGAVIEFLPQNAKLIYLTPSHQFPTNVTLSIARRRRLVDLCAAKELIVLEDDYDSEFRYQGRPTPALKSLAGADRVIYLGSFSKFLAPGLRLGYLVGPPDLVAALRQHQRYQLRHPPGHLQRALALMISTGAYQLHLRKQRTSLKRKWGATLSAVRQHLPLEPPNTAGGTSLWLTGPTSLDSTQLARSALDHGIIIEPGPPYYFDPSNGRRHFRVGFSAIKHENIEPGIKLLGALMHHLLN